MLRTAPTHTNYPDGFLIDLRAELMVTVRGQKESARRSQVAGDGWAPL
ncbi:MAG TPA: hypothetical protein VF040_12595 [Ktedonobacterales bacterium]